MSNSRDPSHSVVLLAYHFPPSKEVGGLRAAKVARALRDAGYRVIVITARLSGETGKVRLEEPGLVVQVVTPQRNLRELYASLKRRRSSQAFDPTGVSEEPHAYTAPSTVPFWKRLVFALMWLPDDKQGFVIPAIRAARKHIRSRDTAVYTSAPPFSSHLAGWRLKQKTGVKWIAEFRDPWTDNPWKPYHVRTRITDALERLLERRCLKAADLVVVVSEGIERVMGPKMKGRSDALLLIRNGIDRLLSGAARRTDGGPFRVVHVGSFYHGRDPRPFLKGLALLRTRSPLTPKDIEVKMVGECRWFDGASIERVVADLDIADLVRFEDWIPHEMAQELVNNADLLLLLAQNQPDQVPNKLYEYLGARRPILAFADRGGESARMLERVGGHFVLTEDSPEFAAEALAAALATRGASNESRVDLLESWTSARQMRCLVDAMEKLS